MMIEEIYKIYPEKWFLEEVFDRLMIWNRWWDENRNWDGYLCWGSNEFEVPGGDRRMLTQHNFKAASNESGLDNTPMYDGVPFDKEKNMLAIADAGLMGLYIGDCKALVKIAQELGRDSEVQELKKRIKNYSAKLEELWSEEEGLYLNKHMYSGELSHRISPTNFYPLIAEVPSQAQAERMINEHLLNPDEFWGEWVLPSISRNDTAYTGKEYWRGSIWAPMNFLVYYGMRNYDLTQSTDSLVQKSKELLLKEWNDHGFVRENYHAETGGHPGSRSENFYHWGALLGMPELMEKELVD
jgi:glycogen debranching enzyme